jgi:hypothetical protein
MAPDAGTPDPGLEVARELFETICGTLPNGLLPR